MSVGYHFLQRVEKFKYRANLLGLQIAKPTHLYGAPDSDRFALIPLDDHLPIFCRDAEIFIGNLDQAEEWIAGYEWARNYFFMIKATNPQKIQRCEQNIRNADLLTKLSKVEKDNQQI